MKRPLPFHSDAVWPSAFLVGWFVALYGLVTVTFWLIALSFTRTTHGASLGELDMAWVFQRGLVIAAPMVHAAFRLWRFHPACNPAYAAWLKLSPWTAARPLPLGPVHLVWQDAVVLGVLTAIGRWHAHLDPVVPVAAFGAVYFGGLTLLLAVTHRWWHCLALGFLWPTLALPGAHNALGFGVIAAIIVVAFHGYRQSLKVFPWNFLKYMGQPAASLLQMQMQIGGMPATDSRLGWPFMALSPKLQPSGISVKRGVAFGALAGWWCYCFIEATNPDAASGFILWVAFIAAVFRVVYYCSTAVPPFNLWGRLGTGRLIVPGYDRVLLTPLAVVLVGMVGSVIIKRSGPWYPEAESCALAAVVWVLLCGGPTQRRWLLTGQHRLNPRRQNSGNRQMLRPV